jgi:MinD-like ATPase involved in chromosome partitioning or flagellar assembly
MPRTGPPEIAHDERRAPPPRHAAPAQAEADAQPPAEAVPQAPPEAVPPVRAEAAAVYGVAEAAAAHAPAEDASQVPAEAVAQAPSEAVPPVPAETAAAHTPAEAAAEVPAEAATEVPAEAVAQAPSEATPQPPAEAAAYGLAEAAAAYCVAEAAAAHAPAEAAAQVPAEAVPAMPAEAAAAHAPAEAAVQGPADAIPHARAEAVAQAPAEPVPDGPAQAAAQAAPFATPEASLAPPETPPATPAEPAEHAEPAAPAADPAPPSSPIVVVRGGTGTRPAAVERALGAPGQQRAGTSWREHVRVVPGGHGPGRPDMERRDRARVLLPIRGPRLIVVLGCTVGAGQTVTALMLADVLASLRTEPVAALDLNPGQTSLAELADTTPAATTHGLLAGQQALGSQNNGPRNPGQLDLIAHDSVADGRPDLSDAEYARLIRILGSRYPLTLTDPGATAVARVLAAADQLVLVAPASADAAQAVTMTMEWLDGHGYGDLVTNAIAVINGVSKRSMSHVEQAELVVRGRCQATVRVPWDDHLGAPRDEQIAAAPGGAGAGGASRFGQLRPPVQHAYTALAGVLVSALAVEPARPHGAAT